MRLLTGLSAFALLSMALPALAQGTTEAPANNATTANEVAPANNAMSANEMAPANETAPGNATGASAAPSATPTTAPEGVSAENDKVLWCGHAFTFVAGQADAMGDTASAEQLRALGAALITEGSATQTGAGFDAAQLQTALDAYTAQIATELAGDGAAAKYSYEECIALAPAPAASGGTEAPAPGAAPANDATAPANGATAPADNAMAPANDATAPANNTTTP